MNDGDSPIPRPPAGSTSRDSTARTVESGPPSADALLIRGLMRERVGGFFCNTYPIGFPGVCNVCRGPQAEDLCERCADHRAEFGTTLADRTVLLTYALGDYPQGPHQSAHVVRAYKGYMGTPAVEDCAQILQFMVRSAVDIHRSCLHDWLGAQWDALTFVPSLQRPGNTHPVAALANSVLPQSDPRQPLEKFLLEPHARNPARHKLIEDRFIVPDKWRPRVEGKNVLIVDDTWTTGASAQGAAIAVKHAGAATATILCIDRWLNWSYRPNQPFIQTLTTPYNPLVCPATGDICDSAVTYRIR